MAIKKETRRKQIAEAMIKLMATRGYERASMSELAVAAGINQGLIHYHFKNKQEILLLVLDMLLDEHRNNLTAKLPGEEDSCAKIAKFVDLHLGLGAYADSEKLACWIVISSEAVRQPEVRQRFENALGWMAEFLSGMIQTGADAGEFQYGDPKAAACALIAAIHGYLMIAATARDLIPRGTAAESVKKMAWGLLKPVHGFH